jgi:hypothetical protein
MNRSIANLLSLMSLAMAHSATQAGTFVLLDPPGATFTQAYGVSGNNVVGTFSAPGGNRGFLYDGKSYSTLTPPGSDSSAAWGVSGNNVVGSFDDVSGRHGFVYDGTSYTTLTPPGSNSSEAWGISGNSIVGRFRDAGGITRGFLYDGTSFTTLTPPGATYSHAYSVSGNNVVGVFTDVSGFHGFLYDGTSYTTLTPPGATSSEAYGVSGNNVVGIFQDASGGHGFLYDGTSYTTLTPPGATSSEAYGVSGNKVVGGFRDASGGHGFLYDGTSYTTLTPPGAIYSLAFGVSGSNVVGIFQDANNVYHGFLYTHDLANVPEPATLSLLGIGLAGLFGYRNRRWAAGKWLKRSSHRLGNISHCHAIWAISGIIVAVAPANAASITYNLPYIGPPADPTPPFVGNGFATAFSPGTFYPGLAMDNAHSFFQVDISGLAGKTITNATLSFNIGGGATNQPILFTSFESNGALSLYYSPPNTLASQVFIVDGSTQLRPNSADVTSLLVPRVNSGAQYFALHFSPVNNIGNLYNSVTLLGQENLQMTVTYEVASVPEPATLSLLGIGLAGLIGYRRWTGRSFCRLVSSDATLRAFQLMTACVAALAMSGRVQAGTVTFNINQTWSQGSGQADIPATLVSLGGAGHFILDPGISGNSFDFRFSGGGTFGTIAYLLDSQYLLHAYAPMNLIGPVGDNTSANDDSDAILVDGVTAGVWDTPSFHAYLGFRSDAGNFGWIEYSFTRQDGVSTLTLLDGAYEDQVGVSIAAGDRGVSDVPEPMSLSLLGISLASLIGYRGRRWVAGKFGKRPPASVEA